jgi:heterodisulfide reductase subunit C
VFSTPDGCTETGRSLTITQCFSRALTALSMETNLADFIRDTPAGREADAILRKCVHCGFCTATCPTYQLLGDDSTDRAAAFTS